MTSASLFIGEAADFRRFEQELRRLRHGPHRNPRLHEPHTLALEGPRDRLSAKASDLLEKGRLIMKTSAIARTFPQNRARQIRAGGPLIVIGRWLAAYRTWRTEQIAIAQLHALSDRLLRDIGLTRSEIAGAVKYKAGFDTAYRRPMPRRATQSRSGP